MSRHVTSTEVRAGEVAEVRVSPEREDEGKCESVREVRAIKKRVE